MQLGMRWLTAAVPTFLSFALSVAAAPAPDTQTASSRASSKKKSKKPAPARKKKLVAKAPAIPTRPPGDTPEVKEQASVWRGCMGARDLPKMALDLGVEESRLEPLLSDAGLRANDTAQCAPYVAATGGEGGAASLVVQRPEPAPGESLILDIRKTADGITVTPGACDCPEPVRRVLDFSIQDMTGRPDEVLSSVPTNVRWELDTLMPEMIASLSRKQVVATQLQSDSGPASDLITKNPESTPEAATNSYTVRLALDRSSESGPERLHSVEILESGSGKVVDGAWWLDRPGAPGVFIGMDGLAYERLLWQSPIKYVHKSRGVGLSTNTYRRRVTPKGSTAKATFRTFTVKALHLGTDLAAPKGTEIHTVGDGKIAFAGRMGRFGKLIIVDHGMGYQTYYAHLSVINSEIKVGTSVSRGDVIGLVGSTGHSTAPHLHFETRKDKKYVDPFDNTRQWDFWLLTPDDQERIAMEMLGPPHAIVTEDGPDASQMKASKDR